MASTAAPGMAADNPLPFFFRTSQTLPMPNWLIKAALQRTIALLPKSHKWNELLQKHVTKSIELTTDRFSERLNFCRQHYENFVQLRPEAAETFAVLELGTGWYPTVPVGLFLCGASGIWTYDISPLLSQERLHRLLCKFTDYAQSGELVKILPRARPERVARLHEFAEQSRNTPPETVLEKMGIHAKVQDAQHTGLNPNGIDLFVSTGVLEYIPRSVLTNMFAEFQRVATPGAVTSHYLNLIDQYSYFDSSITPFNFLKFSAGQWNYFNSPLIWQSRLRISDFRELFAAAGFEIVKENSVPGSVADLRKIRLAPEFQAYKESDLIVLTSWLAAKSVLHKSP